MLGTCIKHEWRTFWKLPTILCAITVITTLLGLLILSSRLWENENPFVYLILSLAVTVYVILLAAIPVMNAVYTAARYYKTCYSNEGYLTQTLPITKNEIIISKVIVGTIWNLISYGLMVVSVFTIMFGVMGIVSPVEMSEVRDGLTALLEAFDIPVVISIIICIIMTIISTATSVLIYFASVSLGQTFTKHRIIGAVLYYLVITMVIQIVTYAIMLPTMAISAYSYDVSRYTYDYSFNKMTIFASLAMTVVFLIIGGVCYFICHHMMSKKLNLE